MQLQQPGVGGKLYDPSAVYHAMLRSKGGTWVEGQQQDVHDLFMTVLDSLFGSQVSIHPWTCCEGANP